MERYFQKDIKQKLSKTGLGVPGFSGSWCLRPGKRRPLLVVQDFGGGLR